MWFSGSNSQLRLFWDSTITGGHERVCRGHPRLFWGGACGAKLQKRCFGDEKSRFLAEFRRNFQNFDFSCTLRSQESNKQYKGLTFSDFSGPFAVRSWKIVLFWTKNHDFSKNSSSIFKISNFPAPSGHRSWISSAGGALLATFRGLCGEKPENRCFLNEKPGFLAEIELDSQHFDFSEVR